MIFQERGGWRKGAGMVEERESVRQRDGREKVKERPRWRDGERSREGGKGRSERFFVVNHRG